MSDKIKTILSFAALLLIGYLAGYHSHRYAVKNRLQQISRERIAPGLGDRLLENLQIDASRRAEIKPILQEYGEKLVQLQRQHREERQPLLDSLQVKLQDHLTEEELKRLDRTMMRMNRSHKKGKPGHGGGKKKREREKK